MMDYRQQCIDKLVDPWEAIQDRWSALDYDIRKIEHEIKNQEGQLLVMKQTRETLAKWLKENSPA